MAQIGENTKVSTDLKFLISFIVMVVGLVGTYYNLVGQVNAIEVKVEKFDDYPSANEINMKNELIRQTVLSNKETLDNIEEKLDPIINMEGPIGRIQKLEGDILNFSLTSIGVTIFFQVGEYMIVFPSSN